METYVLIEKSVVRNNIDKVVRTYESKERAEQDVQLLQLTDLVAEFEILTVEHIGC